MSMLSSQTNQTRLPLSTADVKTAWAEDPMNIVVMLFDKTLLHISRARATLTGWSDDSYQTNILRAVDVIRQLQLTLDRDNQHTMAENLNDVYCYTIRILVESIHNQNTSQLNHASQLLIQIRESLSIFVKKSPKVLQH